MEDQGNNNQVDDQEDQVFEDDDQEDQVFEEDKQEDQFFEEGDTAASNRRPRDEEEDSTPSTGQQDETLPGFSRCIP
jgi:hypothetical protein